MSMFNHILVPVDGSKPSMLAARKAAELAKRDAQIAMQTLQAELDKRYAEAGELRSLIAHLVPAAPPASAQ